MAGTLTISTLSDGTNSTSSTNCIQGSAKAWVRCNGSAVIASSYNVSSVTRSAAGIFYVNFTNAMPNTNFSLLASTGKSSTITNSSINTLLSSISTTRTGDIQCYENGVTTDPAVLSVSVFSL